MGFLHPLLQGGISSTDKHHPAGSSRAQLPVSGCCRVCHAFLSSSPTDLLAIWVVIWLFLHTPLEHRQGEEEENQRSGR